MPASGVRDPVVNKKDMLTFPREHTDVYKWYEVLRCGHQDTAGPVGSRCLDRPPQGSRGKATCWEMR